MEAPTIYEIAWGEGERAEFEGEQRAKDRARYLSKAGNDPVVVIGYNGESAIKGWEYNNGKQVRSFEGQEAQDTALGLQEALTPTTPEAVPEEPAPEEAAPEEPAPAGKDPPAEPYADGADTPESKAIAEFRARANTNKGKVIGLIHGKGPVKTRDIHMALYGATGPEQEGWLRETLRGVQVAIQRYNLPYELKRVRVGKDVQVELQAK